MNIRIIGAILIIAACGGFGFRIATNHVYQEKTLQKFVGALDYMECELQYRLTPLPILCRQVGAASTGVVSKLFFELAQEMESQVSPDVERCVDAALSKTGELPPITKEAVSLLGKSLGRFDIDGQLKGLDAVRQECRRKLVELNKNKDSRIRGYQTLGLCAGAALVILFI